MRFSLITILAIGCAISWAAADTFAQGQPTVAVGFRNRTESNLLVRGYTIVNGVQRSGPSLAMKKSQGMAFETNVPAGTRYYTVYDANNPLRVYLRDFPVFVTNRDLFINILPSPTDPNSVVFILSK